MPAVYEWRNTIYDSLIMAKLKPFNLSLRNLTYRLRKFRDILDEELKSIILENEAVIVTMIADEQLYNLGENGRGKHIMDYQPYAQKTIKKKIRKGQPYDRVTLRDTGNFHKSFYISAGDKGFSVVARDIKARYLIPRYGEAVLRLSEANLKIFLNTIVRPELAERLKERLTNED